MMEFLRKITVILLVVILPATVAAQMADEAEVKEITEKYDLGLTKRPSIPFFDMSRFDLSHSYSIGYFSGSGFSGTQAYYNGTLQYQLANPLTLTLNLGILHDPGTLFGNGDFSRNSTFLPSGWLVWQPSGNFMMSIGFETVPAYYNYNRGSYYFPGRSSFWRFR